MASAWTQTLTEMSTRNISWGKGDRCGGLTSLPTSCESVSIRLLNTKGLPRRFNGVTFEITVYICVYRVTICMYFLCIFEITLYIFVYTVSIRKYVFL